MVLKNRFFRGWHLATKQKVVQRIFWKDEMAMKSNIYLFKVYPKFFEPKTIKRFSISLKPTNTCIGTSQDTVGQRTQLVHKGKLFGLWQRIQNWKALIWKSDLKHIIYRNLKMLMKERALTTPCTTNLVNAKRKTRFRENLPKEIVSTPYCL